MRRVTAFVLLCCVTGVAACGASGPTEDTGATASGLVVPIRVPPPGGYLPALPDQAFVIRTLGSRCVDAGPRAGWVAGAPVTLRICNGSEGQQINITELDLATHDVALRIGTLCLGVAATGEGVVRPPAGKGSPTGPRPIGRKYQLPRVGDAVQLQDCAAFGTQRFAVDGDAILFGAQADLARVSREWVLEPQEDRTPDGTPLVVGSRELSDAEYFLFEAADHSKVSPTSGFVRVSNEAQLDSALQQGGWGTVIEVDDKASLVIEAQAPECVDVDCRVQEIPAKTRKGVRAGVTIRGNRLRTGLGGELLSHVPLNKSVNQALFWLTEDDIRITGLRITGVSTSTADDQGNATAIGIDHAHRVIIDRNDITGWTRAAIDAIGGDESNWKTWQCKGAFAWDAVRPTPVRAVKNFIHHNQMHGMGYGFSVGGGAYALAQGNIMTANRHCIGADAFQETGYRAFDNLFLSAAPDYGHGPETDADVHGAWKDGGAYDWLGGIAGDHFDVGWNTFLGTNRSNFYSRGKTCRIEDVHDNVTRNHEASAADFTKLRGGAFGSSDGKSKFDIAHLATNRYSVADPTLSNAVGDFDGDGIDDVFVGTGAGWYFSSGGRSEWRFLNRKNEKTSDLRFGDFDGDGRTDVLAIQGTSEIVVSWAGLSDWEGLNVTAGTLADLAVGDFDGDHVSDLFYANGTTWYYAPRGRNWTYFATSGARTPDLRFADFTGDGRTDVLGRTGTGQYAIVSAIDGTWTPIGIARTPNMKNVVAADFDGDGFADVGYIANGAIGEYLFKISKGGAVPFDDGRSYPAIDGSAGFVGVGHFDGADGADLVWWNRQRAMSLASSASSPLSRLSLQDMR